MSANRFEVYLANGGLYRWRLRAAGDEIVAVGQAHETEAGALREIDTVKRAVRYATVTSTGSPTEEG